MNYILFSFCVSLLVCEIGFAEEMPQISELFNLWDRFDMHNTTFDGDTAFIAAGNAGLQVIDCSDPADLRLIAHQFLPGVATGLSKSGNMLAVMSDGVTLLDVTDLSNITVRGRIPLSDVLDIILNTTTLYVARSIYIPHQTPLDPDRWNCRISTYDLSDIDAPVLAQDTIITNVLPAQKFAIHDHYLFCIGAGNFTFDLNDPLHPTLQYISRGHFSSSIIKITQRDTLLFASDIGGEFSIISTVNPMNPAVIYSDYLRCYGLSDFAIYDTIGYFVIANNEDPGLRTIRLNLNDLAEPHLIDTLSLDYSRINNHRDYLVGQRGRIVSTLTLGDPNQPLIPVPVDSVSSPGYMDLVTTNEGMLACTIAPDTIALLNIQDQRHPIEMQRFSSIERATELAISSTLLAVASDDTCRLWNITIPLTPVLASVISLSAQRGSAEVSLNILGDTLYATSNRNHHTQFTAWDIADIGNPIRLATVELQGQAPCFSSTLRRYYYCSDRWIVGLDVSSTHLLAIMDSVNCSSSQIVVNDKYLIAEVIEGNIQFPNYTLLFYELSEDEPLRNTGRQDWFGYAPCVLSGYRDHIVLTNSSRIVSTEVVDGCRLQITSDTPTNGDISDYSIQSGFVFLALGSHLEVRDGRQYLSAPFEGGRSFVPHATKLELVASPNPANGFINFTISPNGTTPISLVVYNVSGQMMVSKMIHQVSGQPALRVTIDLSGLSSGVYFVRATQGSQDASAKFAILR